MCIDFIEHIEKYNPYHGKDGRFASKRGGSTVGASGEKVKTENGGTVTIGRPMQYDMDLSPNNIERGNEYVIRDIMNETFKVGTYKGTKTKKYDGKYHVFQGRDGKEFTVSQKDTGSKPIFEVDGEALSANTRKSIDTIEHVKRM